MQIHTALASDRFFAVNKIMQFEGAYYINLCRRPERDFFLRYSLGCQGFPLEKIFRVEGVDAEQFETDEEALLSCSEMHPEMGSALSVKDSKGFPGKGDICCIAAWKNMLTRVYNDLTDTGIALCLLDDVLVRKPFDDFIGFIDSFDGNVDIVQLFNWKSDTYPSCPRIVSRIHGDLLIGIVNPGDTALLLSKRGAKNILDVYKDYPGFFLETMFYIHQEKFPNFYSVRDSCLWIGYPGLEYIVSDRINANHE